MSGPMRGGAPMGGGPPAKSLDFRKSVRRLVRTLAPHRVSMAVVMLLSVGSVVLMVLGPWIIGKAVDQIYSGAIASRLPSGESKEQVVQALRASGNGTFADMVAKLDLIPGVGIDFGKVGEILLVALAVYVVASLLQYGQGWILNGVVQRVMASLRARVEEKLHRIPLSYFDNQPRGELLSRVTNDIDNLGQSMTQTLSQLLVNVMMLIGVLVMMLVVSPLLTLIAIIVIPAALVITTMIMKRSGKQFVAMWMHTGALNGQIEEAFSGHELVTVFGRRDEVTQRFVERNQQLTEASYKAQFISGLIMPLMMFIGNVQYVIVCVVGGLRVASGTLTLGDVTAFIQYSRQFTQPLTQLASMVNLMQSGVASAERVFALLDAPEQQADSEGALPSPSRGQVQFENVTFGYQSDRPLIEDLNLMVEPGQTVAVVGPTGAGKTTLVNLIMRFYELNAGRILLDGTNIADVPRDELRSRIGMVLQDAWTFEGTISDNIRYGNENATDEQITVAAQATFVDRFAHSLPDGLETVIGEDGGTISAGERQLITIARAFLAEPTILILDEATSSVDTRTEVLLQQAMNALRADRTSFVIAHRLSTIRDADIIVVMEEGRIVEQGSHDQLLAAKGAFYRLHQAQFEGAMVDEEEAVAPSPAVPSIPS